MSSSDSHDGEPASPRVDENHAEQTASSLDPFYIIASAPLADEQRRVLKQGETFAVFDHFADILPLGLGEQGIFHEGTRYLSCLLLRLGKDRPLFLSSTVKEDNELLIADLTNPDIYRGEERILRRGALHIMRTKFLWEGICYEEIHIINYSLQAVETSFSLQIGADYADIFEVRGSRRKERGVYLPGTVRDGTITLAYRGLDEVVRRTIVRCSPSPSSVDGSEAHFQIALPPQGEKTFIFTVACESSDDRSPVLSYESARTLVEGSTRTARAHLPAVHASNEPFNAWIDRANADLYMMISETPYGPYPYAGVPWFSTAFGRDGIITALETLWVNPPLARGVLAFLAATQAKESNEEQEADPGKILHETRNGEMANLQEIPFGKYYGSVDSTPLFVVLAHAYYERTGDRAFIESIWENIENALRWIDTYGDFDGDGFVEYQRRGAKGLVQQGWKDSHDSVFHNDGSLAEPPVALCEVQGYVYAAKIGAAVLARVVGESERSAALLAQAHRLQEQFERAFWLEELSTYALALDGNKRPCRVHTSNAGQLLFTRIATGDHARRVAQQLLSKENFSGWGIRTLAHNEARYNPMSYHNGSIWPHDNALIALGMSLYRLKEPVLKIFEGMYAAATYFDLHRLPELFCGFRKRNGEGPTLYPVACAPQAWAAGSVYLFLQAALGLHVLAEPEPQISFHYPTLPEFIKELRIENLLVRDASIDLALHRHGDDVGITVLRREGDVRITIVK